MNIPFKSDFEAKFHQTRNTIVDTASSTIAEKLCTLLNDVSVITPFGVEARIGGDIGNEILNGLTKDEVSAVEYKLNLMFGEKGWLSPVHITHSRHYDGSSYTISFTQTFKNS